MNKNEVIKQFVRIFVSGAISTAIAIMSARRFDHWWAGLVGVPIAILLCDVKQSIGAIKFVGTSVKDSSISTLGSFSKRIMPDFAIIRRIVTALYIIAVVCLAVLSVAVVIGIISTSLQVDITNYLALAGSIFCAGLIGLGISSDLRKKARSMSTFPVIQLLRVFSYVRSWDLESKPADEPLCKVFLKDQNGKLCSMDGIGSGFKRAGEFLLETWQVMLCAPILPILLVDAVLTVFLRLAVSKGVSSALGVIVGFSVDYFFCPHMAMPIISASWLIVCSLLGGFIGWAFWILKQKLSELPLPSDLYEPSGI